MEIVNISKKKFNNLDKVELSSNILGTEGEIYSISFPKGREVILKRLFSQEGYKFANKLYTLEMLDTYREYIPDYFVLPEKLVSIQNKIEAFTCSKVEGPNLATLLNDPKVDLNDQVKLLKQIGQTLDQMSYIRKYTPLNDFYLNDLHEANFMVEKKTGQVRPIDLDSCKIADNKSFPARYLTPFSLLNNVEGKYNISNDNNGFGHVIPNEDSELYCYCITILNYLYGENINNIKLEEYYDYLYYLEAIGINKELIDIFKKLVGNAKNENPLNYLDSLTYEQVGRAKKKIYKLKR